MFELLASRATFHESSMRSTLGAAAALASAELVERLLAKPGWREAVARCDKQEKGPKLLMRACLGGGAKKLGRERVVELMARRSDASLERPLAAGPLDRRWAKAGQVGAVRDAVEGGWGDALPLVLAWLGDAGADFGKPDAQGVAPLHALAARRTGADVAVMLAFGGASLGAAKTGPHGRLAASLAVEARNFGILRELAHASELDEADARGRSLMTWALETNKREQARDAKALAARAAVAAELMRAGADPLALHRFDPRYDPMTALEWACKMGMWDVAEAVCEFFPSVERARMADKMKRPWTGLTRSVEGISGTAARFRSEIERRELAACQEPVPDAAEGAPRPRL